MSNEQSIKDLKDYALAYLLIDLATLDDSDCGSPMSDEELSLLFDPDARDALGEKRCKQIMAQISQDQSLYDRWLILSQSRLLDGPFAAQSQSTPSYNPSSGSFFSSLLESIKTIPHVFTPKLSYAGAFSLAVVTALGTLWLAPKKTSAPQWTINPAQQLPNKANKKEFDTLETNSMPALSAADQIAKTLACSPQKTQATIRVCYTTTLVMQHWFLVRDNQVLSLTPAPVAAQKINSVKVKENIVVIDYVNNGDFALGAFRLADINQREALKQIYTDRAVGGYFDEVSILDDQLNYIKYDQNDKATQISIPLK